MRAGKIDYDDRLLFSEVVGFHGARLRVLIQRHWLCTGLPVPPQDKAYRAVDIQGSSLLSVNAAWFTSAGCRLIAVATHASQPSSNAFRKMSRAAVPATDDYCHQNGKRYI